MTPSQLLSRIEAHGSIDAKFIDQIRKQIEDPAKVTQSEEILKDLLDKNLITKAEAEELLAPPTADKNVLVQPAADSGSSALITPSQLLARIEARESIEAIYIEKIRKQVEDPAKVTKSKSIVKFLLSKNLITKAEAKKLLAPPTQDESVAVRKNIHQLTNQYLAGQSKLEDTSRAGSEMVQPVADSGSSALITPSQLLARIEARESIEAIYIEKIRKQIEDPAKVTKSKSIVKFLLSKNLVTKAEAKKLLAPPTQDESVAVQPATDSGPSALSDNTSGPKTLVKPTIEAATAPLDSDSRYGRRTRSRPMIMLAFLNFHRRFITGALLLAGVTYLLMHLNAADRPDDADGSVVQVDVSDTGAGDVVGKVRSAPTEITDQGVSEPTAEIVDQGVSESFVGSTDRQFSESITGTTDQEFARPVTDTVDQKFAAPVAETADQRIDWLLMSSKSWEQKAPEVAVVMLQLRHVEIEKLINGNDLKPRQRAYCVQEYIKAVGLMSEINQTVSAGVEGIDEKVASVVQAYEESEDDATAALVKAVRVGHLLRRFTETQNDEDLEAFKVAFSERRNAIANADSDSAKKHITKAISDAIVLANDNPYLREIAAEHLSSVLYLSDDSVVDLAKNLYFPKVDWQSLGSRLQTRSPGADNDVQLLLTGIKEHPDLPLFVYSAIGSAIRWYQAIDENEKANQFLGQLEEVRPTITAEHIRDEVQKGIELLKTTAKE